MRTKLAASVFASLVSFGGLALADSAPAPAERRLHIGQADASSYDKNDWNRFEENYLPLYVADDDPRTAWTEGAPGDGPGEWLRMKVSTMKGATRVRLNIRNGYQKSHKLFVANARAKRVAIKLLPGGMPVERDLTDTEGWQEVAIDQLPADFSGVEIKILSSYPGTKYADLCISDVQIFATAQTPDNPAYEKSVYDRVNKWKADRIAAAAAFKRAAAGRPLPIATQYDSTTADIQPSDGGCSDFPCLVKNQLKLVDVPTLTPPEHDAIKFLSAASDAKLADWESVQVVAESAKLPNIDGTCAPEFGSCEFDSCPDPQLPIDHMPLLDRDSFRVVETKPVHPWSALTENGGFSKIKECKHKQPVTFAWAKREGDDKKLRALFIVKCGLTEGREGSYPTTSLQLLVYGDDGHAHLVASDRAATTYRWEGNATEARLVGGHYTAGSSIGDFKAVTKVAQAK